MYNYFLSREAKEDLWRIYEFGVYKFEAIQAEKYFNLIYDCFDKIALNPFMFPEKNKNNKTYRFCVCESDTIIYEIKNQTVQIITIVGKQDY